MQRSAGYYVIKELIEKFPDAPAKTLARRAFTEHPECWSNLEACRFAIRAQLGAAGDSRRKAQKDKSHFREPRKAGWSDVIPEALVELPDWIAVQVVGPHRCLILSDIHIPYHDPDALEAALDYAWERKPTLILLNGDICDHYAVSKYQTDPKQRDFAREIAKTVQFLAGIRKQFPKAKILWKLGNHEERYERYLSFKAPELLGVPAFEWSNIFSVKKYGVEMVKDKRPIRLGELNVIHGHEYRFQISNPVNPARGFFLRAKAHTLGGHLHQTSQHSEKTVESKVVSTWSTGCLCNLTPAYAPLNPWNHGFAFVDVDKNGAFQVENKRIIDGKVW